jgi:hypothetical protein
MDTRKGKKTGKNTQVSGHSLRSKVRYSALYLTRYGLTMTQGAPTDLHDTIQAHISNPGRYWTGESATVRRCSSRSGRNGFLTHCNKATSKETHRDSGATLVGLEPPTVVTVRSPLTVRFPGKGARDGAPSPSVVSIQSHLPEVLMC